MLVLAVSWFLRISFHDSVIEGNLNDSINETVVQFSDEMKQPTMFLVTEGRPAARNMADPRRAHNMRDTQQLATFQEMAGTLKLPPAWSPKFGQICPFKCWSAGIVLWSMATDVPLNQQAPAITLRLGGVARSVGRGISPVQLRNGGMVDFHDRHVSTSMILIFSQFISDYSHDKLTPKPINVRY